MRSDRGEVNTAERELWLIALTDPHRQDVCPHRGRVAVEFDQHVGDLEREPDPANRRRNVVRISTSGRQRLAVLTGQVRAAQDELLGALSEAERRTLVRLLTKLLG